MAWNQQYLPPSVLQQIAANPDLYQRSITKAPDRANSLSLDFGSGEGLNTGTSPFRVNSGNGLAQVGDTWNGQRLWDIKQDSRLPEYDSLGSYRTIDSDADFTDTARWKPGAEQAILGSAKFDPKAGLMIDSNVLRQYYIPKEPTFMDTIMSKYFPALVVGSMAGAGLNSVFGAGGAAAGETTGEALGPVVEGGSTGAIEGGSSSWADSLTDLGPEYSGNLGGSVGNVGYTGLENAAIPGVDAGVLTGTGYGAKGILGLASLGTAGLSGLSNITKAPINNSTNSSNSGKPSLYDQIKGVKSVGDVWDIIKNNPMEAAQLFSGLYGMYQSNQNKKDQQGLADDLMKAGDPFGEQRSFYQDKLKGTYTDPMAVYNTPEYQGLSDLYRQGLERKDAAAGRRSQYSGRELEMNDHFLNYLQNYRNGLLQPAGAGMSPNINPSAQASNSAINAGNNQAADLIGLARIFFGNNGGTKVNRNDNNSNNSSQGYDV